MTGLLAISIPSQPAAYGSLAGIALTAFFLLVLLSARGK